MDNPEVRKTMEKYLEKKGRMLTMTLDNGEILECTVVCIYDMNERDYIALSPVSGEEKDSGKVYLYGLELDADGQPELRRIENDSEYEAAGKEFDVLSGVTAEQEIP